MTGKSSYKGYVKKWKVELIRARVRVFGFPAEETHDLVQELVPKLRRFRFDPRKSNGAKEATVLRKIIDRHLSTRARAGERGKQRIRVYQQTHLGADLADDTTALRLDVRLTVQRLTPAERVVCDALGRGQSLRQAALALGCSDHKVRGIVDRLRGRFERLGLAGWLGQ
jgi:hypothetical protein